MLNVGVAVTKPAVDAAFGGLATRFAKIMDDAAQANFWLSGVTDEDLTGLGYTAEDIVALKDAAYAYGLLAQIYSGQTNLVTATDYRVSIRKLAGLG